MVLICITLSGVGLHGVNLNLVMDDLRMMVPKPVAAKEGGMKDYEEGCGIYVERWKGVFEVERWKGEMEIERG